METHALQEAIEELRIAARRLSEKSDLDPHDELRNFLWDVQTAIEQIRTDLLHDVETRYKQDGATVSREELYEIMGVTQIVVQEEKVASSLTSLSSEGVVNRVEKAIFGTFPDLPDIDIMAELLGRAGKRTRKILPYLLTAYYLYAVAGKGNLAPKAREMIIAGDTKNSNYERNLARLCGKFSLQSYLRHQVLAMSKKSDSNDTAKDGVAYRVEVANPQSGLPDALHAAKFIQAFLYCLFAELCSRNEQISQEIDYALSFRLFDEHTYAFVPLALSWNLAINYMENEVGFRELPESIRYDRENQLVEQVSDLIRQNAEYRLQLLADKIGKEEIRPENDIRTTQILCGAAFRMKAAHDCDRGDRGREIGFETLCEKILSAKEIETAISNEVDLCRMGRNQLYQHYARLHYIYFHPLMGIGPFWPALFPEDYHCGWAGAEWGAKGLAADDAEESRPDVEDDTASESERVEKFMGRYWSQMTQSMRYLRRTMLWSDVQPLLRREKLQ